MSWETFVLNSSEVDGVARYKGTLREMHPYYELVCPAGCKAHKANHNIKEYIPRYQMTHEDTETY